MAERNGKHTFVSALCIAAGTVLVLRARHGLRWDSALPAALISLCFGLLAWRLKATTSFGAVIGAVLCFMISLPSDTHHRISPLLYSLILLFVLTQLATRFRREQKERLGLAEARHGRAPSQILANLAAAAIFAALGRPEGAVAALGEATADTLASECGQALGGSTRLITTWKSVAPGTDGAMSVAGTLLGSLGAVLVILVASSTPAGFVRCSAAALLGFLFDSLLGATLERSGLIGNDGVNLCSTIIAGLLACSFSY